MPSIPASGPISMSMFNTVLGRASNTSNSSLAGGTTPAVGSQFYLANQSGSLNQTAPHAMSEWYGYTTVTYYTLNISYNFYSNPTGETLSNYGLYYSVGGGGGDILLTTLDTGNTCTTDFTSSLIAAGSNVYFGIKNTGKAQTPVQFDVDSIGCPNTINLGYCGTFDTRNGQDPGPFSFTINADAKYYITVAAIKGFFSTC